MSTAPTKKTIPPFTLSSPAGVDIWRKPPSHDAFTAPTHPSPLPQYPLEAFQRARVTFTLPPTSALRQYDQAGLLLHLTHPSHPAKWLKTGIEFYYSKPYISTVGCDQWADWSVVPLLSESPAPEYRPSVTVEACREKDGLGKSLWVYVVKGDGKGGEERMPVREVCWFFGGDAEEGEGWTVGVGGMVARPTVEGGEGELACGGYEGRYARE